MKIKHYKFLLILFLILLFSSFFYFDFFQYLNLDYIKNHKDQFSSLYSNHPFLTLFFYFLIYVVITALSVPGALVLTLFSGFLFGFIKGSVLVSFASTLGATCSFLISRFLFKSFFIRKFQNRLSQVLNHLEREGAFYLFTLRLIPVVPFFLVNILMGLSPLRTRTFFIVSQIGMLPATLVYVNAGHQISQINDLKGFFSLPMIFSLILIAFLSLFIKKVISFISSRRKQRTENV